MTALRSILAIALAAATLSLPATMPARAQMDAEVCLTDTQIQAAIKAGEILSWPKIKRLAGLSAAYDEVSGVEVCLQDGVPYYYVNVVSPEGEASKIVVNAMDGAL
ncbi:MAG: hypothetical protein ABIO40_12880 [Devosia sp.]